jgi:superfamily I DNA and/or RNA helicase
MKKSVLSVITAYNGQVELLKENLKNFKGTINTIDGFQGQEREIIFYSTVRSNRYEDVGFLSDERRFNVAMTRAKRLLIVVGNEKTLKSNSLWNKWLKCIVEQDNFRTISQIK